MQRSRLVIVSVLVVMLLPVSPAAQLPDLPGDAGRVAREVTAAFEAWISAFKSGDKAGFMNYLWKSEDFIVLTRTGEIVRGWENFRRRIEEGPSGSTADFRIVSVLPMPPDNAVLIYTAAEPGEQDPLKVTRGTMVWARKPEGWRCINFQFARPEVPAVPGVTLPSVTPPTLPPVPTIPPRPPQQLDGRNGSAPGPGPRTRAESSAFDETSRYDDVLHFIDELQKTAPALRVETFGVTQEGRSLPLLILADPPVSRPAELRGASRAVVFVMANIHAGEVEGKEAAQTLARRLAAGDLRPLLDQLVVLIAPIYNADGNERIDPQHRWQQNGPIAGVGVRENAGGLDLNRDYMKLESPEARALVGLLNRWDPHLTVDLHTTNGSYHGYHLTWAPPLNPNTDPRLDAYHRQKMLPAITASVRDKHGFRTYAYGNFGRPRERETAPQAWRTFDHRPRFGNNYAGLRNRLAILSEAYSYLEFRRRVEATEAFVEEILRYAASHASEIAALTRSVDEAAREQAASAASMGVAFEARALPDPVEILVGEVEKRVNPRSGREMTVMIEDRYKAVRMQDFGQFAATASAALPRAYLFEPGLEAALEKLTAHGVAVEELTAPVSVPVERFRIEEVRRAERPLQGHREVKLTGRWENGEVEFPAGTLAVRTDQSLARLIFSLLEPESDDGLTAWNFLDAYLEAGATHPVYKVAHSRPLPLRLRR